MARANKSTAEKIVKRVDYAELKKFGIVAFDFDNAYPQRVEDIHNDSGTGKKCLRLYKSFVAGQGMNDPEFGKAVINSKGETVNDLLRKLVDSKGKFTGLVIHCNYNGLGKVTEVQFVPFPYARLTLSEKEGGKHEGKIAIHSDWTASKGNAVKPDEILYINRFAPSEVARQVENITSKAIEEIEDDHEKLRQQWALYGGQILYYTGSDPDQYPLSPVDAVLEDMQTEAQIKRFKYGSSARNFLGSHVVITGKEEEALDGEGNPIESDSDPLSEVITEFQGGDGAGGVLHLERESNEEQIQIEKFDIQDYDGLYEWTKSDTSKDIIGQFMIPELLFYNSSTGFSSTEMANAKEFYNEVTQYDRKELAEILEMIFSNFHIAINRTGDYSIKPLTVAKPITKDYFPYYSKKEIRDSLGDETIVEEGKEEEESALAIDLGVGGTQSLLSIITDPILTPDQKKGSLKVLFGLSDEEINAMLSTDSNISNKIQ